MLTPSETLRTTIVQAPSHRLAPKPTGLALASLIIACCASAEPAGTAEPPRVGEGDSRIGYDSTGYITQSRSLSARRATSASLAELAANPPSGLDRLTDPPSRALIDLGRRLFFDRRLSANETLSCGNCHVPEQAFTQNELATPVGIEGALVLRNAPSLYNVAYRRVLFLDGRETSLEQQIWAPLLADNEMGNADRAAVLTSIQAIPEYRTAFKRLFSAGVTESSLGEALAAYQRALLSANSPFDRWFYQHEQAAVSDNVKQGFAIFQRAGCASCHTFTSTSTQFSDDLFHNTGTGFVAAAIHLQPPARIQLAPGVFVPLNSKLEMPDRRDFGREAVTGRREHRWQFRTPTLRNVALTSPYMHDGSITTLKDVVTFYNEGGGHDPSQDPRIRPLQLSPAEQQALIQFLESLTGDNVDALAADARTAPIGDRQAR